MILLLLNCLFTFIVFALIPKSANSFTGIFVSLSYLSSHMPWALAYYLWWTLLWFAFWGYLSTVKPNFASSIIWFSVITAFAIVTIGILMGLNNAVKHVIQWNNYFLLQPLRWITVSTFPVLVVGVTFLSIFNFLTKKDPFQERLGKNVSWPIIINHARFLHKATKRNQTYLGYNVLSKEPVYLSPVQRSKHTQIIGSTGSGKTRYVLFPMIQQDIAAGNGVVIIDAKGSLENAKAIFKMVKEAGRIEDFLIFSLTNTEYSSTYNPLQLGNPSQLKDKVAGSIDWSEPFYQRACESALQTLFMELAQNDEAVSLTDLNKILKTPPQRFHEFCEEAERNEKNIRTLHSEINILTNTPFAHLLSDKTAEINLMDVYQNQKIAYFALDTQSYHQTAMRLGKLITQDLNTLSGIIESTLTDNQKKPLSIFIDEFQAFGTRGFVNTLARGRSSGFWITIAHQSIGDLTAIDEAYSHQIIENTNNKIFLHVNDPVSAELFSNIVGTHKTVDVTSQIHLDGEEPNKIMGSQSIVHEFEIHPSDIKRLETGQAVFKSGAAHGYLACNRFIDNDNNADVVLPIKAPRLGTSEGLPKIEDKEEILL